MSHTDVSVSRGVKDVLYRRQSSTPVIYHAFLMNKLAKTQEDLLVCILDFRAVLMRKRYGRLTELRAISGKYNCDDLMNKFCTSIR